MSAIQKRRVLSDSHNAMSLMIGIIGDMPISWIDADDLCKLSLELGHRISSEWSSYNTVRVKLTPCEAPISVKCWIPLSEGRKDGDKSRVRCSA